MTVGILDPNATYALGISLLVQRCGLGPARVWQRLADALPELQRHPADLLVLSHRLVSEFDASPLTAAKSHVILTVDGAEIGDLARLRTVDFKGVLLRDASEQRVVTCLRAVAMGHAWLDPELCDRMFHAHRSDWRCLSKRELQVARLAAGGLSNKHIARALKLSDGTVKIHLHHVFAKLHVSRRNELGRLVGGESPGRQAFGALPQTVRQFG